MALVGSLFRGGAQQPDGFVQLLLVHNDSKPELPRHSSPSDGPELLEHKAWGSPRSLTLAVCLLGAGNAQKW